MPISIIIQFDTGVLYPVVIFFYSAMMTCTRCLATNYGHDIGTLTRG